MWNVGYYTLYGRNTELSTKPPLNLHSLPSMIHFNVDFDRADRQMRNVRIGIVLDKTQVDCRLYYIILSHELLNFTINA